ncbi:hypothetical protein MRX96_027992 [Rhipicephalus microplus]
MTRWGKALVNRLLSLPRTGKGSSALDYASLISDSPVCGLLFIPLRWDSRLSVLSRIPGIRNKGHTPRSALLIETCALIEERYSDHLHVYTDGSVNKDGSSAAVSIIKALRGVRKCHLLPPGVISDH